MALRGRGDGGVLGVVSVTGAAVRAAIKASVGEEAVKCLFNLFNNSV